MVPLPVSQHWVLCLLCNTLFLFSLVASSTQTVEKQLFVFLEISILVAALTWFSL